MELWVRSTAKTNLLKVRFLTIMDGNKFYKKNDWEYDGYTICNCNANGTYELLGTYKTKERALEVLDEIQRILKPAIKALTPLTESKEDYKNHCMKTELVGYETTYDIVALPTYVYEMPSE